MKSNGDENYLSGLIKGGMKGCDIDSYAYLRINKNNNSTNLISNYPSKWLEIYFRNKYYDFDPVVQKAKYKITPFLWDKERNESNISEKDQIKLYPVPVTTELNYNITDKDLIGKKAMLINGSGNIVKTITFNSEKGVIDFTKIGYGVYYLVIETKKGKISKKILKQGLTDNNQDIFERKK